MNQSINRCIILVDLTLNQSINQSKDGAINMKQSINTSTDRIQPITKSTNYVSESVRNFTIYLPLNQWRMIGYFCRAICDLRRRHNR